MADQVVYRPRHKKPRLTKSRPRSTCGPCSAATARCCGITRPSICRRRSRSGSTRLRQRDDQKRAICCYNDSSVSGQKPGQPSSRKWRNWQTHQLEGLAFARTWGFESPLSHQPSLTIECEGLSAVASLGDHRPVHCPTSADARQPYSRGDETPPNSRVARR
jgi:hypothetical protein